MTEPGKNSAEILTKDGIINHHKNKIYEGSFQVISRVARCARARSGDSADSAAVDAIEASV